MWFVEAFFFSYFEIFHATKCSNFLQMKVPRAAVLHVFAIINNTPITVHSQICSIFTSYFFSFSLPHSCIPFSVTNFCNYTFLLPRSSISRSPRRPLSRLTARWSVRRTSSGPSNQSDGQYTKSSLLSLLERAVFLSLSFFLSHWLVVFGGASCFYLVCNLQNHSTPHWKNKTKKTGSTRGC